MKNIFLLLMLIPNILLAQNFSSDKISNPSFKDLLSDFDQYKSSRDLSKTKGWKWYKRWEQHYEQRTGLNSEIPDASIFLKEVEKIQAQESQQKISKQSNWLPFGPENLPPSVDAITSHGMGRINCIAFHPTDSNIIYVGVAQGGLWKSTTGGQSWTPLSDQLPLIRISDIAIDPNNPNTIYISVGDYAYIGVALKTDGRKRHTHYGIGVYKSTDGGTSWSATGLSLAQNTLDASLIRRVMINGNNSQELVAVGLEGIWKSYDAGATWTKKYSEIIWDLERTWKNSTVLFASTGYIRSLGEGNAGIIKSLDFGETWTILNTSIPTKDVQRVEIAISNADSNYLYAVACGLDRGFEGFYKSTNYGNTWTKPYEYTTGKNLLGWGNDVGGGGQGTYDLAIVSDHNNANKVYVGGINMWGTADGGSTWNGMSYWLPYYGEYLHADQHQFAYNPLNNAYYVANDGGLYRTDALVIGSWDLAETDPTYKWPTKWRFLSNGLQISSFYRLGLRKKFGDVIAGAQDNSTFYRTDTGWVNMIGGDGMDCALHPTDPLTLYGSSQFGNIVQSFDGGISFNYLPASNGELGEWTTPFKISENNPSVLYAGYENMQKSTDEGFTFSPISQFPQMSNGVGAVISHFDVAKSNENYIYVAKRINHQVNEPMKFYVSTNGGNTWNNRTTGLPDTLYATNVCTDDDTATNAWVCFSGFAEGAKVYKTNNSGQTWINISYNLPNIPLNTIVHQNGSNPNIVYVGTDAGVYYLIDGQTTWVRYSNNLPNVIISDLEVHVDSNKLFAASFGRGIWMSDLVSQVSIGVEQNPLENMDYNLYPNTNKGIFTVELNNIKAEKIKVSIVDITGRLVFVESSTTTSSQFNKKYELNLMPGMYFYRIEAGKYSKSIRFRVEY